MTLKMKGRSARAIVCNTVRAYCTDMPEVVAPQGLSMSTGDGSFWLVRSAQCGHPMQSRSIVAETRVQWCRKCGDELN